MSENGRTPKAAGMPLQTLESVQDRLKQERGVLGSWEAVARKNELSVGTVCRVASGYEPRRPDIRAKLGLPVLLPAPACPHCGAPPHAHRNCPARRNGHRTPGPHRLAINLDDAASAARSILRNMDAGVVAELVKELTECISAGC